MIVPPFLSDSYINRRSVEFLNNLAYKEERDQIIPMEPWVSWREIFEYVSCVEYAHQMINHLPTGKAIGSIDVVPARYHSASLVFYAQAALDLIAVWLVKYLKPRKVKVTQQAFHKESFKKGIIDKEPLFIPFLKKHDKFVKDLERYRKVWIHKISGGAQVYSDKSPNDPDANQLIAVPIEPELVKFSKDNLERIEELNRERGSWLYPIGEFANQFSDNLNIFINECIDIVISNKRN